jgi:hypothetical protein
MIVIVVKKLRGFVEGQFWWVCHQSARAKKFWHHPDGQGYKLSLGRFQSPGRADEARASSLSPGIPHV